jgi:methionyl-tRNA formyltransferase
MNFFNIVILGVGKMAKDCAAILLENGMRLHAVHETEKNEFSPLPGFCSRVKIAFQQPTANELTTYLSSLSEPTILFSINNNYLFPQSIVKKENLRIINFHNSLLPRYRGHGRVIPVWVIFNGESHHGVTWHLVDENTDTGNILCQRKFKVSNDDTALNIMMKAIGLGTKLFSECWKEFINPENKGHPQKRTSERVYGLKDIPNDGYLDISWDFDMMARFLRCLDYEPFSLFPLPQAKIGGKLYQIKKYQIIPKRSQGLKNKIQYKNDLNNEKEIDFVFPEGIIKLQVKERPRNG